MMTEAIVAVGIIILAMIVPPTVLILTCVTMWKNRKAKPKALPAPKFICTTCGTSFARPKTNTPGSMSHELLLWLLCLLPGLIYGIWRMTGRRRACPECGSREFVAINSPRARTLAGAS